MDLKQLETELNKFFSDEEHVVLAYLFCSTVRGEANRLSDIDIAVLFDNTLTKKEAFDLQLRLIVDLGDLRELPLPVQSGKPDCLRKGLPSSIYVICGKDSENLFDIGKPVCRRFSANC